MAPKSTRERWKKYRQKHEEVYREKDALRKRSYRQKMKANPIANEERLRVQREKKQKYWQRVKESIATATAKNLVTEQNDDSAFSHAHIKIKEHPESRKSTPKKSQETQRSHFSIGKTNSSCANPIESRNTKRRVD